MAQNYDLTQTGPELQARVDQVFPNRDAIEQETVTREAQDESLETSLKAYTDTEQARAEAVEGALDTRVSANEVDIDLLKSEYEALTQSDIIVGPLPSTGQPNKIYRVPGSTYYTDYMWANGGWVKLAEYSTLDGYVYKGIATPSGNPVQSAEAVFYFAVQPGTYTNYGGLVVTDTIAILKYNGTAWTKDDVIAIDDEPTAGSDNLVTSGAVAASVVYDISAANAVGGQLETYADLAAALDGGANVPVDVRKGGMEIKFVQSSDNKYVQYRLMANTFSTTAADWQGVDDEPIAGSENLVKSGGVYNTVISEKMIPVNTYESAGINASDGTIKSNSYMQDGVVLEYALSSFDLIKLDFWTATFNNAYLSIAFYKNGLFLNNGKVGCNSISSNTKSVILNNFDADTVRICVNAAKVTEVSATVERLGDVALEKQTAIVDSELTKGSAIRVSNGEIVTNSWVIEGNILTIAISKNEIINVNVTIPKFNAAYAAIALYKGNVYIKTLVACTDIMEEIHYVFVNDYDADTVKICFDFHQVSKRNVARNGIVLSSLNDVDIVELNEKVVGNSNAEIPYTKEEGKSVSNLNIGDTISLIDNGYRNVAIIPVQYTRGLIEISWALETTGIGAALVNSQDKIIDIIDNNGSTGYKQRIVVNLSNYNDLCYIYCNFSANDSEVSVKYTDEGLEESVKSITTPYTKGILLLHFDSPISPNDNRMAILKEFGIPASWCISKVAFNNDNTFASGWTSNAYKDAYWDAIKRGDDVALYPALPTSTYDENGWKSWLNTALGNLANYDIFNITTFAAGKLSVNYALVNALKEYGFKIARGGGNTDSALTDEYHYTDANKYMPITPQTSKFLVNYAYIMDNSLATLPQTYEQINYCISTHTAVSLFTHQVEETLTEGYNMTTEAFRALCQFIKNKIDEGVLEVMTWREYYAFVNSQDGGENDNNRIMKMLIKMQQ